MALTGSRVDLWLIHFVVDTTFLGVWDTMEGGETDTEEAKYRPGGYDVEISLGGRKSVGNVTLSRYYDDWVHSFTPWLRRRAGKARVAIARYPMTAEWQILGEGHGFNGTLKSVTVPDIDSDGGSDVAKIEVECTIDGVTP